MSLSLANDVSPPCELHKANPNEGLPVTMITRTYQLNAADPFRLYQRLRALREALGIRGGKITKVQWRGSDGKHSVNVRYEVPESFVPALCL
jgi:hypothetical protein